MPDISSVGISNILGDGRCFYYALDESIGVSPKQTQQALNFSIDRVKEDDPLLHTIQSVVSEDPLPSKVLIDRYKNRPDWRESKYATGIEIQLLSSLCKGSLILFVCTDTLSGLDDNRPLVCESNQQLQPQNPIEIDLIFCNARGLSNHNNHYNLVEYTLEDGTVLKYWPYAHLENNDERKKRVQMIDEAYKKWRIMKRNQYLIEITTNASRSQYMNDSSLSDLSRSSSDLIADQDEFRFKYALEHIESIVNQQAFQYVEELLKIFQNIQHIQTTSPFEFNVYDSPDFYNVLIQCGLLLHSPNQVLVDRSSLHNVPSESLCTNVEQHLFTIQQSLLLKSQVCRAAHFVLFVIHAYHRGDTYSHTFTTLSPFFIYTQLFFIYSPLLLSLDMFCLHLCGCVCILYSPSVTSYAYAAIVIFFHGFCSTSTRSGSANVIVEYANRRIKSIGSKA